MKKFLFTCVMAAIASCCLAARVDRVTAMRVANSFRDNHADYQASILRGMPKTPLTDITDRLDFANLYVFADDHSFVIVAADDCVQPILAYSMDNTFGTEPMPDNVGFWLRGYDEQIALAIAQNAVPTRQAAQDWEMLKSCKNVQLRATAAVAALLKTTWNQSSPYNNLCPSGCPTGCVATAMAQVMNYWKYPTKGIGSHSYEYTHTTYGIQEADFGATTYDWSNMRDSYSYNATNAQRTAVATLMRHCGVSIDMNYGPNGSSAQTAKVALALKDYFNYDDDLYYAMRDDYTDSEWIALLKAELDASTPRPVQYQGFDTGAASGHSFVLDGYDNNNRFHVNWGWGGSSDGWFTVDNLRPGSYNFSAAMQAAIFGVRPPQSEVAAPIDLVAEYTDGQSELSWKESEGAVSYNVYRESTLIATGVASTQYIDHEVPYGTVKYYVRAVDSDGHKSAHSNFASVVRSYDAPIVNDLAATVSDHDVTLTWSAPAWCYPEEPSATLFYGDNDGNGVCGGSMTVAQNNGTMYWGHRYRPATLSSHKNKSIYKVSFYANYIGTYELYVYEADATSSKPQTLLRHQSVTSVLTGWIDIVLNEPLTIEDTSKDIWVFLSNTDNRAIPATYVSFSGSGSNYGNYTSLNPLQSVSTQSGKVFLIKTFLTDGVYTYNLYRDNVKIASEIENTRASYTDSNLPDGHYAYYVTTNYYKGESDPSNVVEVDIPEVIYPIWTDAVKNMPEGFAVDGENSTITISSEEALAWLISYVNGYNGCTAHDLSGWTVKLTKDLDMSENAWVPIGFGNTKPFKGTFDGQCHTIDGIHVSDATEAGYVQSRHGDMLNAGLFGYADGATIRNTFVTSGTLLADKANANMGGIAGTAANSTSIEFCESAIGLESAGDINAIGGIAGEADNSDITAVMAVGDITINGTAANAGAITGTGGTVNTFYACQTITGDATSINTTGSNGYCVNGNGDYAMGTTDFSTPTAYTYGSYATNNTVGSNPLVDILNADVNLANGYKWMRPTTQAINGDYPIIVKAENDGFAIVNESANGNGKVVRYGEINTLLGMDKYQNASHSVFMYNNDELTTAPVNTKLYIDEHVALTQSDACGDVTATVGVTIENRVNTLGAMGRDWHMVSTPLKNVPLGITYYETAAQTPEAYPGEGNLTLGIDYAIVADESTYFPEGIDDREQFDFYSYYEPKYHWINMKRASTNHWQQDGDYAQIEYTNEEVLQFGKGYMIALGDANEKNLIQAKGVLNNNAEKTVPITAEGEYLKGYNLLGNPFQSYLDFNEFVAQNPDIWASGGAGYRSYVVYDAEENGFNEYLVDANSQSFSTNAVHTASRYINMHQGFFIVKNGTAESAKFTSGMRKTAMDDEYTGAEPSFRDNVLAYPLVNLFCTDGDGKREVSVIEMERPVMAGSLKMKGMLNGKCNMYIHWNGDDLSNIFIDHMPDFVPVWFDAAEDGVFTMTWSTANAAFGYMHLIDNLTGTDTDCLTAESYTFQGKTTDMSARFRLVFSPLSVKDITAEGGNFAFFDGNELVVNGEGDLSLIDLNGRILATKHVSGQQSRVSLPVVAEGMYMLRMATAEGVRVQKIVIRK